MQKSDEVFIQLSAALTSVQLKMWLLLDTFSTLGWSSISFHFCRIAFSSYVSHIACQGNSGFSSLFLISISRAKATQDFLRCSWFHQCWSMGTTLTRLEPFRLFSFKFGTSCKNLCMRDEVNCIQTYMNLRKQYDRNGTRSMTNYTEEGCNINCRNSQLCA